MMNIHDDEKLKRIELHCHTKMSSFNGINHVNECLEYAIYGYSHSALAITDINSCQSFIQAASFCSSLNNNIDFKLIYGAEFELLHENYKYVVIKGSVNAALTTSICIDLETTGLYQRFHEIIEIGVVQLKTGAKQADTLFHKYVKISAEIPPKIHELTGITNQILCEKGEPEIEVISALSRVIDKKIIVAHNARFDYSFIKKYFKKYQLNPEFSVIDSMGLARYLYPKKKSYKLERLVKMKNIQYDSEQAHSADYDANLLSQLWAKMLVDLASMHPDIVTVDQLSKKIKSAVEQDQKEINLHRFQRSQH